MSETDKAMTVLHETVGHTVEKEIIPWNAVVNWRRDDSWNTLESLLGISTQSKTLTLHEAMQQHAVLSCVDVISRDISKVDVDLCEYLEGGGTRKVMPRQHWLAEMLASDPNDEHTWDEFWQMATIHLVMMNNMYVGLKRSRMGDVREFIPLIPARCQVNHNPKTYEKYLWVSRGTLFEEALMRGMGDYLTADQFIHVRKRIVDGLYGLPTLYAGGPTMALAKSINDYQGRIYDNDGQGRVTVEADAEMESLSDEAFQRLKSEIRAAAKKMLSSGEAMLLEPGYKAKILAMSAADAKVSEMHDATINAVARVFGVPPHKIGHIADEKYSNLEVLERTYAHDVLIPIARAFEKKFARALLTREERQKYFLRFNRKQMEIIDYKQRAEAMKIGLQHGAVMPDEFREEFGMNPLKNGVGQVRFVQSTMTVLEGTSNEVVVPAGAQTEEPQMQEESGEEKIIRLATKEGRHA